MTSRANILVVDDENIERQTLAEILRLEGYHVTAVANGESAVDYVRLNPVDLILLDLRMPGMSGLDVIKVINHTFPEVAIILFTAHGSMESAIEALKNRVQDYLLKPATPAQILESVARGLARRTSRFKPHEHLEIAINNSDQTIMALRDGTLIDFGRRFVKAGSKTVFLTPAEGRLLRIFAENIGKVFTHRELVLLVQGYSTTQQEAPEILRPLVSRLRQKLTSIPTLMERIVSVRGTGYVFEND
jgi:DNA-binding response OmpR family regulator